MADVEGQRLLAESDETVRSFVYFPNEHYYTVCALWSMHANMFDIHGTFIPYQTPRLYFGSTDPGCGKTLAAEIVSRLCGGKMMTLPTVPGMVSSINMGVPILFDEFDKYAGTGRGSDKMIGIINSGYKKGGVVTKTVREQPVDQSIHGPMLLTGKNAELVMRSDAFSTIRDRMHMIWMEERPEEFQDDYLEFDPETHDASLDRLAKRMRKWAVSNVNSIVDIDHKPLVPKGIKNRERELWKNLYQIAHHVGGEWIGLCESACRALALGESDLPPAQTPSDELLKYVRIAFGEDRTVTSATLTKRLMDMPGDHWWKREWNGSERSQQIRLAGALRVVGITPMDVRNADGVFKTYRRNQIFKSCDVASVATLRAEEDSDDAYSDVREPVNLD